MVYTITLNPSVDYVMECENLKVGSLNRSGSESYFAGGKGINVSVMLNNLGIENTAMGFLAGFTGKEILNVLESKRIKNEFIFLSEGNTRINVKIKGPVETEINGIGPFIKNDGTNELLERFKSFNTGDIVIISGSEPKSEHGSIYKMLAEGLNKEGIGFIADTTGKSLRDVLPFNPLLVKPNKAELEEFFGKKAESEQELIELALKLQSNGAENVLVSLGKDGALLVSADHCVEKCRAPEGKKINTVGSGDSMVAGWTAGYIWYKDYKKAFMLSVAAGSASAFSENIASGEKVLELYKKISI
ncbi:1-phosphofructokinase [Lachnospiraceae bacterium NSJ-143]|nr:1-phosphofructokinase [Lachnospiraceae bacterium NSJ-143]